MVDKHLLKDIDDPNEIKIVNAIDVLCDCAHRFNSIDESTSIDSIRGQLVAMKEELLELNIKSNADIIDSIVSESDDNILRIYKILLAISIM